MDSTPAPTVELHVPASTRAADLAADVRAGLTSTPKRLPPKWLYDEVGCDLFDAITELPEYYPTRAERAILDAHAAHIAAKTKAATLIELGSGTSEKTRLLLDALDAEGTLQRFVAFDVAEPTLRHAVEELAERYPGVAMTGVVGDFERDLDRIPRRDRRLVAFLGGTIGNLEPGPRGEFLGNLARQLDIGEWLLLGTDLVKDAARLVAAYDDAAGVTAAFERNVLAVVNTALDADFDLSAYDYVARWDADSAHVAMSLRARLAQEIHIKALDLVVRVAEGEEITTETSAKFRLDQIEAELNAAGFSLVRSWRDPAGDFAVNLAQRTGAASGQPAAQGAQPAAQGAQAPRPAQAARTTTAPAAAAPPRPTADGYMEVRQATEGLAAPLSAEDQTVQTMPDVSPTKWHRAHVTWFFEQFVLMPHHRGYRPYDERYLYLFNSYYEGAGPRHPRTERGLLSRPGVGEVTAYRQIVDEAVVPLLEQDPDPAVTALVELGLHHEQQHQELLLMDIKHVLGTNPLLPAYRPAESAGGGARGSEQPARRTLALAPAAMRWVSHPGGLVGVGREPDQPGFCFDNETPHHQAWLEPYGLSDRLVTAGEWLEFMADGGYRRPDLWLSDGWAAITASRQESPLYWWGAPDGAWWLYTLTGARPVDPSEPVVHVSYYEADAFARWYGARLPTEAEWETLAAGVAVTDDTKLAAGHVGRLHPGAASAAGGLGLQQLYGSAWQWTASSYLPYPRFAPNPGVVGEYNGKFMVGQHALRGSCVATPPGHARLTYRNFFPPSARWPFTGVRLARNTG